VAGEGDAGVAAVTLPDAGAVVHGDGDEAAVGGEGGDVDRGGVAAQALGRAAGERDDRGAVVGGGEGELAAVGAELGGPQRVRRAGEADDAGWAAAGGEQAGAAVGGGGEELGAVGGPGGAADRVGREGEWGGGGAEDDGGGGGAGEQGVGVGVPLEVAEVGERGAPVGACGDV
jgi:hypothetical protein